MQGLPLIRGKSQKSHSWLFVAIRSYSWLFVAIRGYKKPSGLCENTLNLTVIPCHCVYFEVFSIFHFQNLNFDPLKAQYGQNMTQSKINQNIRAHLWRNHKVLVQIVVTKNIVFKISFLVICGYSWLFVVIRTTNEW